MADMVKFQCFSEDLCRGKHQFHAHTFKLFLTNVAPSVSADSVLADLPTEVSNGGGYTTGGLTLDNVTLSRSSGVTSVIVDDELLTASGQVGPFRYAVLYNA